MSTDTPTPDRLLALWQELCDELEVPVDGISVGLVKAYASLYARFQLERVAQSLRADKFFSAAREVEARSDLLADLSQEL